MYLYQKEKEICTRALLTNALSGETDLQSHLWRICSCFREKKWVERRAVAVLEGKILQVLIFSRIPYERPPERQKLTFWAVMSLYIRQTG